MSAAHTCFRSALSQAFRSSKHGTAASCTVPVFLVPALARPLKRTSASGKHRTREHSTNSQTYVPSTEDAAGTYYIPPKPIKEPIRSSIPFPPRFERGDIRAWLAAIDPYLPVPLRREKTNDADISGTVTSLDLACVLNKAQDASLDIINYVGLEEGRWQTAIWMAKKLVEDGRRSIETPVHLDAFADVVLPDNELGLKELTEHPVRTERLRPSRKLRLTLDDITSTPYSLNSRQCMVKRALGQLWRCLGNMILVAADRSHAEEDQIMSHVLEIIAHLHHMGFMPDSVYAYRPHEDKDALQQPPTLHMMSSKILTALSDATWKAHEISMKAAKNGAKASYFLGHEIPTSRYQFRVSKLSPELWLELVLWSCLHGGWTVDGTAIVEQIAARQGKQRWTLLSWREIMQAEEKRQLTTSRAWSLFSIKEDTSASAQDRARTHRTISAEVVTAFVDGLMSQIRLGVGDRGVYPDSLVHSLETLKKFLDANNLSLGSIAWDSVMVRMLESGGFDPEQRPELLLRVFQLAPGFGAEISTTNASASINVEVPYFFEPATIALSLLHRTMRAFIALGDIKGAMTTLMLLQRHTDDNKQKSVQQFFETLKGTASLSKDEPLTSRRPPVEFPAFDTKLPVPLLARLLDLATDSKLYDLGRWLLFSDDLDGPLIGPELYDNRNIAASIVRFGTLAGENDLVLDIVKRVGAWNEKHQQQRMPAEILIALLCSQVRLRRWDSVRGIQKYVQQNSTFRPRPIILSTFAAELLRTSSDALETKMQAQAAFSELLLAWEKLILGNIRNELYCILSIMSTVDSEWTEFCAPFLAVTMRQNIKLSTDDFNKVLSGILDGNGSKKGWYAVKRWCYNMPKHYRTFRSTGGLLKVPKARIDKGKQYDSRPKDLELIQDSGATVVLQGRVLPNRQTIRAILAKIQEEVDQQKQRGESWIRIRNAHRKSVKWAARMLYWLGYEYEDVLRDVGSSVAEFAEIEAPIPPNDMWYYHRGPHKQGF